MITQTINLNLIPGGVLPRINVSQYDKGSRTLNFNIYNGSVLFNIPTGSTITIQGTKPDHTGFQYSCEYEGSVVTADLEQQMSVVSGEVTCEIIINKDLQLIGTGNFILNVEPAAVKDDTVISETELPLIEQAIEAVVEAEASAISAAESAEEAASWSAHPPYIGENGNWYVYDPEAEEFIDTGDPSRGPQGIQGETGPKGDTGVTPDITMNASVDNTSGTPAVVVTETGTDEDPVFSLAFSGLKGPQGDTGEQGETGPQGPTGPTGNGISNITKTGTSGLVDTYTITYTDGTTSTFTVTNGRDGSGSGDMSASDYDPTESVKNAGGIPDFVAGQISGKQNIILSSALPIGGVSRTTVEEALGALANETGGHTILNESGTELPQRSKLQFEGAIVSDDETNNATVVETVNPVEYEEDIYGVNLFKPNFTTKTENGITCTVNSDNSISTSGTTTADTRTELGKVYLVKGTYVLSGNPYIFDASANTIRLRLYNSSDSKIFWDDGNGITFTIDSSEVYTLAIKYGSGVVFGSTFKPMLRKATIQDDTYRPYNHQSIQHQLTDQTNVLGAKNRIPYPYADGDAFTYNGITYIVNSDKSITANGTSTSSSGFGFSLSEPLSYFGIYQPGKYILSCGYFSVSSGTVYVTFKDNTANKSYSVYKYGTGYIHSEQEIVIDSNNINHKFECYIFIATNTTVNNAIIKPMLRLASDPDNTYVPYAMTNRELTEKKINLSDLKTIVSSSNDFAAFKTAIANL